MSRNVLVVTTVSAELERLRREVLAGGEAASVRVIAPVVELSRTQWLTNEEDAARQEARQTAADVAGALKEDAEEIEAFVGDSDPTQAIEDSLRTFPADELVLVTKPGFQATWLEQGSAEKAFARFGLPIRHVVLDPQRP